jgi:hypothetical protein
VDSYRFLPRSFVPMYADPELLPGETDEVWAAFEGRLADASIALLTSAGLSLESQPPFDLDRERREATWGDPTHRLIPHGTTEPLRMSHLHVNNDDVLADHNIALPMDVLDELVTDGTVGASTGSHVSVMGFQEEGLDVWRHETAPAIIDLLRSERTDGVVLAPV